MSDESKSRVQISQKAVLVEMTLWGSAGVLDAWRSGRSTEDILKNHPTRVLFNIGKLIDRTGRITSSWAISRHREELCRVDRMAPGADWRFLAGTSSIYGPEEYEMSEGTRSRSASSHWEAMAVRIESEMKMLGLWPLNASACAVVLEPIDRETGDLVDPNDDERKIRVARGKDWTEFIDADGGVFFCVRMGVD